MTRLRMTIGDETRVFQVRDEEDVVMRGSGEWLPGKVIERDDADKWGIELETAFTCINEEGQAAGVLRDWETDETRGEWELLEDEPEAGDFQPWRFADRQPGVVPVECCIYFGTWNTTKHHGALPPVDDIQPANAIGSEVEPCDACYGVMDKHGDAYAEAWQRNAYRLPLVLGEVRAFTAEDEGGQMQTLTYWFQKAAR